jgi:hypothetical protein
MSRNPSADPEGAITYALTSRLSAEGRVAISLRLYRGQDVAHSRSLGVVEHHELVDVMRRCRMHLDRLGVERLSGPDLGMGRVPPAQRLQVKRNGKPKP